MGKDLFFTLLTLYRYSYVPVYHRTTDHIKEKNSKNLHAKNDAQTPGYYQKMVGNDLVEVKSKKWFGNA